MQSSELLSRDWAKLSDVTELMDRLWAPCRYNCPVHADVRKYLEHAAQGRFQAAIDVIREALPLAGVCGRICHHPCEANCRRKDVDTAVAIREVKRFVAERQGAAGSTVHKAARQDLAKVAIVGGGPAGLAAALELAKKGYRPTIFERFPVAGGIPATAIPKYRLPREVIQIDVDWILAHGVELVTGVEIGKDKTIDQLRAEGFKAVLLAVGLAKSRSLPLVGGDHPRVRPVLEFLTELALADYAKNESGDRHAFANSAKTSQSPFSIGKNVLVIGGGNVAVDAARSAVRLGARVRMMCLENEQEMPAWSWEQDEAREEGIEIIHRRGPVEVVVAQAFQPVPAQPGKAVPPITGVKARRVTRVFDDAKRFSPTYDDADAITLDCDTVILAIGQMADTGFVKGSGLAVDSRGRLEFTRATHRTNLADVFACGEIVTPPGSAVEACANGHRAARAIDLYLSGQDILLDDSLPPYIETIDAETAEKVTKVTRQPVLAEPPATRKNSFAQFDHNYTEIAALTEARRCMGCGSGAQVLADKCAGCLTCLRVCPFDIPEVSDVATIDCSLCQACGMCIAECPARAIIWRGYERDYLVVEAGKILAGKKGHSIAFICGHKASAAKWAGQTQVPGVSEIIVPSVAGVGVYDLMKTFELGAKNVLVVATTGQNDRFPQANRRLRTRVAQTKALLAEAGLKPERLEMIELDVE